MCRTCLTLIALIAFAVALGCESNKPPPDVRIQISDIQQVTEQMTTKLVTSDFMKDRTSDSPAIVITCRRAENLTMDLIEDPELWMFVAKIEASINSTNLARAKNIIFQLPPERVEMLRKMYPEIASGARPTTHYMTCSIRDANRVTNDKHGYVNGRTRLYYFDYNITRLSDGAVEWNGSAEFKRAASGKLGIDRMTTMGKETAKARWREGRREESNSMVFASRPSFAFFAPSRFVWFVALLLSAVGCTAKPDMNLVETVYRGELGEARQYLIERDKDDHRKPEEKARDRNYVLEEMRVGVVTISDGYCLPSDPALKRVYETLEKSGVNKDKEVASFVFNEQDVKMWKGDPFEQALALVYIAMHQASRDSWDNARSASIRSLFSLRDFSKGAKHQRMSKEELVMKAAQEDQQNGIDPKSEKGGYLDKGYVARETNFALGYLMAGIANQQYGIQIGDTNRLTEAGDYYNKAVQYQPELREVVDKLQAGPNAYNTILVVDFGRGPKKVGTGMDQVIADFKPKTQSTRAKLVINSAGQRLSFPQACDVNELATDAMWQSFEDARKAKSYIGTGLLLGGAGLAAYGIADDNQAATIAGAGMALAGAYMKAQAHADTRYCEVIPQRFYVAPIMVTGSNPIDVEVAGQPQSKLTLAGLTPPTGKTAQLRCVRLITDGEQPPRWADSGQILYASDAVPNAGQVRLPFILGGDDVRIPSEEVLSSYQQQGFLIGFTLAQLRNLYKAEGISIDYEGEGTPGLHVLEGGKNMISPLPGTLGFARLFGQRHPAYKAQSDQVRQLQDQYRNKVIAIRNGGVAMSRITGYQPVVEKTGTGW